MKKIIALTLTLILALCIFSACGGNSDSGENSGGSQATESATPTDGNSNVDDGVNDVVDGAKDEVKDSAQDVKNNAKEKIDDVKENPKGESQNSLPEVSENTEVVKEDKAPKIYMIEGTDSTVDNITYHLEGCKTCEGKNVTEIPWEMAQMIGFWQCPECNPPRYEGYKNAK